MINADLFSLAARQFGVVSRTQLGALDVSVPQLSRARRANLVIDVTSRTIRLRSSPDTFLARCAAVSLHLGDRGFLAGVTAGRLHGLRDMNHSQIAVAIPEGDNPSLPDWVDVRRTNWYEAGRDRRRLPGAAIVSEPHRMLYDLAARLNDRRFQRAAEDCWHHGLVTPQSAAAYLGHHRRMGKDGTLRIERWLALALDQQRPAQSGLELDVVEAIRAAGLAEPVRQHPLDLQSGQKIHVDLAWPNIRLCVEPGHSWWHGGDEGLKRDNKRRLGALAIGWETIQLDESLRHDPAQAVALIESVYRRRQQLLGFAADIAHVPVGILSDPDDHRHDRSEFADDADQRTTPINGAGDTDSHRRR